MRFDYVSPGFATVELRADEVEIIRRMLADRPKTTALSHQGWINETRLWTDFESLSRRMQAVPNTEQEEHMRLKYGMFLKSGKVVQSEPLESGGRRLLVELDGGGKATIDLSLEELRLIVGQPKEVA